MKEATVPGKTTKEIDEIGGRLFKEKDAVSAPIANMTSLAIHASASITKWRTESQVPVSLRMAIL